MKANDKTKNINLTYSNYIPRLKVLIKDLFEEVCIMLILKHIH